MTAAKKTWMLRDPSEKTHKYIELQRSQIATTVHEKAQNNRSRQGGSRVSHGPWRKNRNLQVRFHPHVVWSWLARTDNHGFLAPCVWNTKKSTSNHMNPEKYSTSHKEFYRLFRRFAHTHTHPPAGGWKIKVRTMRWKWGWKEVKMRWKWRWDENYSAGTRGGERKRRGKEWERENTNTTHLAQNGQTLKG